MEWHNGSPLSQTVFTLLYGHHIRDINPEFIPHRTIEKDPIRPLELVTVVLRAAVSGLLKTCDLSWRELNKSRVYDVSVFVNLALRALNTCHFEAEDWQSEKCEISLLEGVDVIHILQQLDDALEWLRRSSVPGIYVDALSDRLLLRKVSPILAGGAV